MEALEVPDQIAAHRLFDKVWMPAENNGYSAGIDGLGCPPVLAYCSDQGCTALYQVVVDVISLPAFRFCE
jgi:hypothetical protein